MKPLGELLFTQFLRPAIDKKSTQHFGKRLELVFKENGVHLGQNTDPGALVFIFGLVVNIFTTKEIFQLETVNIQQAMIILQSDRLVLMTVQEIPNQFNELEKHGRVLVLGERNRKDGTPLNGFHKEMRQEMITFFKFSRVSFLKIDETFANIQVVEYSSGNRMGMTDAPYNVQCSVKPEDRSKKMQQKPTEYFPLDKFIAENSKYRSEVFIYYQLRFRLELI